MALPTNLSPSPFHLVFSEIFATTRPSEVAVVCEKLHLTPEEWGALRTADEHVIGWTLSRLDEATEYARLLLRLVPLLLQDPQDDAPSRLPQSSSLGIESTTTALSLEEARHWWHSAVRQHNHAGSRTTTRCCERWEVVMLHYVVSRLDEVVQGLKELSSNRKPATNRSDLLGGEAGGRGGTSRNPPSARDRTAIATVATTFYPDGILLPDWQSLLSVLTGSAAVDSYVQRGAAVVLANVILEGRRLDQQGRLLSPIDTVIESVVMWLVSVLQSSAALRRLDAVIPCLTLLLSDAQCRELFDDRGGTGCLLRQLKFRQSAGASTSSGMSVQQLYELTFCLWLLSYECATNERVRNHFYRCGSVSVLVDLVGAAPREKVVRLAVSTLLNLATCAQESDGHHSSTLLPRMATSPGASVFLNGMVGCGLLKAIEALTDRQCTDPEFAQDLELLHRLLQETCREMTRWDVYVAEVKSGHLKWGFVHTAKFFKENARRMEGMDGNFDLVKDLLKLTTGYDEDVAAIACFDLGEFAKHYPNGRVIAKNIGARDVVMKLIDHENPELQRMALQCVSKFLIQNHQYLEQ